jgi:hypothetical protein
LRGDDRARSEQAHRHSQHSCDPSVSPDLTHRVPRSAPWPDPFLSDT